jgi:DNA-binding NarL/FixJ family response regulator
VHETKVGTDLVREIRAIDAARGARRLIYIVSANDSPDQLEDYARSGADGHIPKTTSGLQLRRRVYKEASGLRRFQGRVVDLPP